LQIVHQALGWCGRADCARKAEHRRVQYVPRNEHLHSTSAQELLGSRGQLLNLLLTDVGNGDKEGKRCAFGRRLRLRVLRGAGGGRSRRRGGCSLLRRGISIWSLGGDGSARLNGGSSSGAGRRHSSTRRRGQQCPARGSGGPSGVCGEIAANTVRRKKGLGDEARSKRRRSRAETTLGNECGGSADLPRRSSPMRPRRHRRRRARPFSCLPRPGRLAPRLWRDRSKHQQANSVRPKQRAETNQGGGADQRDRGTGFHRRNECGWPEPAARPDCFPSLA